MSAENIRSNLSRGRAERAFCAYQSVSDDILENRILRAALERAATFLSESGLFRDKHGTLERWVRSCRSHLHGVSVVRIRDRDFVSARVRGAFSHYRRPLDLARAVLKSTGFDLKKTPNRAFGVVPFALDSAKLFERWAEVCLLEEHPGLQVGRIDIPAGEGGVVNIRPDFWIPAEGENPAMILDAKYQLILEDGKPSQDNIFQMVAYSRHRRFLERLGLAQKLQANTEEEKEEEEDEVLLMLLYPEIRDGKIRQLWPNWDKSLGSGKPPEDNSFHAPLSVWTIPCPEKLPSAAKIPIPAAA